jgi:NarL family two-component system sensor histidine kinase LiaS
MNTKPRFPVLRRLGAKLTVGYALVTVATLLLAEMCGLGGLGLLINEANLFPRAMAVVVSDAARDLSAPLAASPPDLAAIRAWLGRVADGGVPVNIFGRYPTTFALDANTLANSTFYVLDPRGNLVSEYPERENPPPGAPFAASGVPGLDEIVRRALGGERDTGRLFVLTKEPEGIAVAAPIIDPDGTLRGVLVMDVENVALVNTLGQLPALIGVSFVCVAPAAVLIGLLFGFLTARGLTRRLGRMAQTAGAWGRGDFSSTIRDSSPDEIGRLAEELNRMSRQLQELLHTRQQLASAEERNRLARDLHDSVKQQVFAISMNLGTVQTLWERDPAQARARLDAAMQQARQAQKELAALIQTLRPVPLQGKGLARALADYLQDWQAHSGVRAEFRTEGGASLPDDAEQALFRVAQEALANVARHSGAATAAVELVAGEDAARMVVADDGRGFDPEQTSTGYGLTSMRERVQALGGTLDIASGAKGTTVTAVMPVNEQ